MAEIFISLGIMGWVSLIFILLGVWQWDSYLVLLPYLMGILLPLVFMIRYHHKLVKKYKKK